MAAGAGIKKGHQTERVIRQVDVAPTIARFKVYGCPLSAKGHRLTKYLKKCIKLQRKEGRLQYGLQTAWLKPEKGHGERFIRIGLMIQQKGG